jgi:signal peptidase I
MSSSYAPARTPAPARPGPARRAARFAGRVLGFTVLLVAAFVLGAAVLVPRIAGATPYTVLTGSMSPAYPQGTMVVARPVDAGAIGIGAVVTYQLASGRPEVATHRVVAVARTPDGGVRLQTRGDANDAPDPRWVRPEQVRGVLWYAVPGLGRVGTLLTGQQRRWGVDAVAFGLAAYAGVVFVGAARRRLAGAR